MMRKFYSAFSMIVVAAIVTQFYLAGVGLFSHQEEAGFAAHATNGRMVLPILFILSLILAAIAREGKRTIWYTALAILLLAFQTIIFILTGLIFGLGPETQNVPFAAVAVVSLHVVNGLAVLFTASVIARRAFLLAFRTLPGVSDKKKDAAEPIADTDTDSDTDAEPATLAQ
ncbi:DUF6220 domain-containing protein [Microbacterium sp. ASV49]|uniref:DUF6220 domain-containing protein n=1 Tax=Microbacterium candidum TaxID=3041922 RepID=A0ABT7MUT4_9MICO|nr:DUF6220 domain-containing protein [Microbacterium sp. ASV49]MDL9978195.1 DUF6220 domain-containing protein [Microbacterium sp. ASV49]